MSGHNKWSSIKHKKGAADAKRGKLFSRLAKEITVAARSGGGDPEMNPRLRSAIDAAKNANVPNDNIERAVKKGTGDLEGGPLEELTYEGYGPGGVAIMVLCLSDNRNRTAANLRACFSRHNSSLGANGAVAWMFNRKSRFVVEGEKADEMHLMEVLIEAGVDAEEIEVDDGRAEIIAPFEAFESVSNALHEAGVPVSESTITLLPETFMQLDDAGEARQNMRLIEALEDDEDVQAVYSNLGFSERLMKELSKE